MPFFGEFLEDDIVDRLESGYANRDDSRTTAKVGFSIAVKRSVV
jgi:hypothetical protein